NGNVSIDLHTQAHQGRTAVSGGCSAARMGAAHESGARELSVSHRALRLDPLLRPESWTGLAGGSPVPVGTGAPGSRPRFVVETRRAERGVKSLFGGRQCAGRSGKPTVPARQSQNGGAEPLISRRTPCPASPGPGSVRRV